MEEVAEDDEAFYSQVQKRSRKKQQTVQREKASPFFFSSSITVPYCYLGFILSFLFLLVFRDTDLAELRRWGSARCGHGRSAKNRSTKFFIDQQSYYFY